jgi:hypothetical protein
MGLRRVSVGKSRFPGTQIEHVRILLIDSDSNHLHSRVRRGLEAFAGRGGVVEDLGEIFRKKVEEYGAQKCLDWIESTLSRAAGFAVFYIQTAERLYVKHISFRGVGEFRLATYVFSGISSRVTR